MTDLQRDLWNEIAAHLSWLRQRRAAAVLQLRQICTYAVLGGRPHRLCRRGYDACRGPST